jgi:hypothetical protein
MAVLGVHLKRLPEEIGELTMYSFIQYLEQLGKKVNWDYHMAALPAGVKPDEKYHPLSPSLKKQKELHKSTQGSLEDFINKINKSNQGR